KHVKLSPSALRPDQRATVTYTDSARATTSLDVLRCFQGRGRCIYRFVAGFTHHDAAGRNQVGLSARVGGRRLAPGKYLLVVTPVLRRTVGSPVSAAFRVT
ncbi:MAG: hypothetical protein JO244_01810, partial [Solirubrobacterales bacterium]|nr:hypothetical protein [Solirubrobacterales bacterium]